MGKRLERLLPVPRWPIAEEAGATALIRHKGERILTQLREGPIGKLIPREEGGEGGSPIPTPETIGEDDMSLGKETKGLRATLEQWQGAIDERIRTVLPNFAAFRDLEQEVRRLADRLEALERRLADRDGNPPPPPPGNS